MYIIRYIKNVNKINMNKNITYRHISGDLFSQLLQENATLKRNSFCDKIVELIDNANINSKL